MGDLINQIPTFLPASFLVGVLTETSLEGYTYSSDTLVIFEEIDHVALFVLTVEAY
jgi:hypothetical protein